MSSHVESISASDGRELCMAILIFTLALPPPLNFFDADVDDIASSDIASNDIASNDIANSICFYLCSSFPSVALEPGV